MLKNNKFQKEWHSATKTLKKKFKLLFTTFPLFPVFVYLMCLDLFLFHWYPAVLGCGHDHFPEMWPYKSCLAVKNVC